MLSNEWILNNKISGIKLVFSLYATIKMMHGPINIRIILVVFISFTQLFIGQLSNKYFWIVYISSKLRGTVYCVFHFYVPISCSLLICDVHTTVWFVLFQNPTYFPDYVRGVYTSSYDTDSNINRWIYTKDYFQMNSDHVGN